MFALMFATFSRHFEALVQTTILDFGCGELRESIAAKKASVAHFEAKLQDMCPAIFNAVQVSRGWLRKGSSS